MKRMLEFLLIGVALAALRLPAAAQPASDPDAFNWRHELRLSTTTFEDGGQLPLGMIFNQCPYVAGGGDQSPELSWMNAPHETKSFVVVAFDVTAAFTHWGMYNIPRRVTGLPENAGVAGSSYGPQITNDFFIGAEYDGPCPPPNVAPVVHDYVFTVYALDSTLALPSSPNFPADAETLFRAMTGRVLDSASIHGFFSTAP